jgi:hypothetical protein
MGVAAWLLSALAVFVIARIVPPGRDSNYLTELLAAVVAAGAAGAIATALDFGGWAALDWRAVLFTLLIAATAVGSVRAARLVRA